MRAFHLALSDRVAFDALHTFRTTVTPTNYSSYEPFIARLFEQPCRESDIKDLLAPGLPRYIAISSSTSGRTPKCIPRYFQTIPSPHDEEVEPKEGTICSTYSLHYRELVQVVDDDAQVIKNIGVTCVSSGSNRLRYGLDIEKDRLTMTKTLPGATSPLAVCFIFKYRSFLVMHTLFALRRRSLETFNTIYGTIFLDMMKYMEEEWDVLLHSIEHGTIPDFEGIDHVREYLEPQFLPDPKRANELRNIGISIKTSGWLKKIWPNLGLVVAIVSGIFAAVIPKIRYYIGPDVRMRSRGYRSSEANIATVYREDDLNLFKTKNDIVIEYLECSRGDVGHVIPGWEVETGKRYEVVLTTRDGLWRYRLGDVIEVAGFDPEDGSPLVKYAERKNVAMRLGHAQTSEKQLVDAIRSTTGDTLGHLVEFTIVKDDRKMPATFGYIVEIAGSPGPNAHLAVQQVLNNLITCNMNVQRSLERDCLRPPTIRIVEPGTFRDFRKRRIEEMNVGAGQTKVPVVLMDPKVEEWLLRKVVIEL